MDIDHIISQINSITFYPPKEYDVDQVVLWSKGCTDCLNTILHKLEELKNENRY